MKLPRNHIYSAIVKKTRTQSTTSHSPAYSRSALTQSIIAGLSLCLVAPQTIARDSFNQLDAAEHEASVVIKLPYERGGEISSVPENETHIVDWHVQLIVPSITGTLNIMNTVDPSFELLLNGDRRTGTHNHGTLNNFGRKIQTEVPVRNHENATLNNFGRLRTKSFSRGSGGLINEGTLNNWGELDIFIGGPDYLYVTKVENHGTLNNFGTFSYANGAAADYSIVNTGTLVNGSGALDPAHPENRQHGQLNVNVASSPTGVVRFAQDNDFTYARSVSGEGRLEQTGTGSTTLTRDNTASMTDVQAGALIVGVDNKGSLSGTITVHAGATLGGNGTLGSTGRTTTIQSGATLAPGHFGTMNVAGDLRFAPGSVFRVGANAQGQADKVVVAGQAALAGTVQVQAEGAGFAPRTAYTILSADKLVDQFENAAISANYEYLVPELAYTDKDVTLTLVRQDEPVASEILLMAATRFTNDVKVGANTMFAPKPQPAPRYFHTAAITANQYATADGVESLPDTHQVYQHVETLARGGAPRTLDALSGELYASTQAALLASADAPRDRLFANLRNTLSAGSATTVTATATPAQATTPIQPLWVDISTRQQRLGEGNDVATARMDTTSLTVGGDMVVGNNWRAGAALHYDNGRIKVDDRRSKNDLESVGLTLGAGRIIPIADGKLNVLLGAGYVRHQLKSRRDISDSGLNQTLKANYHGDTTHAFGELGYALPLNASTTLEPFAGLAWTRLHTQGFTESGGSAALSGESQSSNTTTSTLGLRAQMQLPVGSAQATLHASAGWRHAYGNVNPQALVAFDGGQPYSVQGAPIARNAALVEVGAALNLSPNATLKLGYAGQFGNNGLRDHAGELKLNWLF